MFLIASTPRCSVEVPLQEGTPCVANAILYPEKGNEMLRLVAILQGITARLLGMLRHANRLARLHMPQTVIKPRAFPIVSTLRFIVSFPFSRNWVAFVQMSI